jgi:hypothetical protein
VDGLAAEVSAHFAGLQNASGAEKGKLIGINDTIGSANCLNGGSSHWALGSAPLVRHWASTLSSRSPCRTTQRRREELTEEEDDIGSNFDQILWLKLWLKKCCIDEKCLERRLLYPLCPIPNETIGQLCKLSGSSQQAHVGNIVD